MSERENPTERDLERQRYFAKLSQLIGEIKEYPRLHYAMVHHQNVRGDRMEFHDKPYLVAIYKDNAQQIVLQSSVQTGKSEFLMVSAFYHAESGKQVMYTLPTTELRNLFVANRVDKNIERVQHYAEQLHKGTNVAASRSLKHFGNGTIFYAGSNSATTFVEKPLDVVIADELDLFDQHNYEKADDRLTASKFKIKLEAGNPSVDNFGINRRYKASDQRELFVKCEHCGKWQRMDWFRNGVRQTDDNDFRLLDTKWEMGMKRDIYLFCVKCTKPLNRFTQKANWVAKFPKIDITHGYLIHQMMSGYVKVTEIWDKFLKGLLDETAMQVFYNSVLGQTFAGAGSKVTDQALNACKGDYLMPSSVTEPCVMGADVGKRLNVVIRQIMPDKKLRLVFAGTIKEFDELSYLFARFNIVGYVLDGMPETRLSKLWAAKHPGRGWIARYHKGLKEVTKNEDDQVLSADRTMLMDSVLNNYARREYINPQNAQSLDKGAYYAQLKTPTRVYDGESNSYNWVGDPDHYYHAEVYCLLAYRARGEYRVVGISPHGDAGAGKKPENFSDLPLPPNAPPELVEHYRRIFGKSPDSKD